MSQWGKTKTIDGTTLCPVIKTATFVPAAADDLIEDIYLLDGDDKAKGEAILAQARTDFLGKPYRDWLR